MFNRRKFLKNGLFAAIGSILFPNLIFSETLKSDSILEYKPEPSKWSDDQINLAWIGHSTVLINFYGIKILTDPVLMDRVGIYFAGTSLGPSRLTPPALEIDEIPKPDIILLSHAHMDHMDYPTLKKLTDKFPNQIDSITAYLTTDVISDLKWRSLTSIDWQESHEIKNTKFTALEVQHFGWRFPWEKDRSRGYIKDGRSYNAYLIEKNGSKILFGGDTKLTNKLNVLSDENIDIAIMPIGAYDPWRQAHCTPEEALKMADDIKAKFFFPIHTKTFRQGREPFEEPIIRLKKAAGNYNIRLAVDSIGQTFTIV